MKYCVQCGFDLSSVVSKRNEIETKPVKKQVKKQEVTEEVETEEEDLVTQIAKNLVVKKQKGGKVVVKPKPSEAKSAQLAKARAARQSKIAERKASKKVEQESEREQSEEEQQQHYEPLYTLF